MKAPKLARVCSIFPNALRADRKKTKKKKKEKRAEERRGGGRGGDSEAEINALPLVCRGGGGGDQEWWIRFQSEEPAGFLQEEPLSVGERRNHADLQSAGCRLR